MPFKLFGLRIRFLPERDLSPDSVSCPHKITQVNREAYLRDSRYREAIAHESIISPLGRCALSDPAHPLDCRHPRDPENCSQLRDGDLCHIPLLGGDTKKYSDLGGGDAFDMTHGNGRRFRNREY